MDEDPRAYKYEDDTPPNKPYQTTTWFDKWGCTAIFIYIMLIIIIRISLGIWPIGLIIWAFGFYSILILVYFVAQIDWEEYEHLFYKIFIVGFFLFFTFDLYNYFKK